MNLANQLLTLSPALVLTAVFLLPALESSAFVGILFPGETALVLGGVLAGQGRLPLLLVALTGVLGAVLGDTVGYAVGRRFGTRLLAGPLRRLIRPAHVERGLALIRRRGGLAVFLGRWTAALRVLVPGLAGMAGVRYRTFALWNLVGAAAWGSAAVLVGYLAGRSWQHVAHLMSLSGLAVVAVIVCLLLASKWGRSHARASAQTRPARPVHETGAGALVVVPTYDEAVNIDRLLDAVLAAVPDIHVLVVDDDSPDGTAALVRRRPEFGQAVHLLVRTEKTGLGAAYRAGFGWALDHRYGSIVQMDADLSHPCDRLPTLLGALNDADVAVGSRYVAGGGVDNWARHRRLISRVGNLYVAIVLGLRIKDATSGFKAFRREALLRIDVAESDSEGYCFQIENAWRSRRRGLRITEVPITFTDRIEGTSKMSGSIVSEALTRVLAWRLRELWGRHSDLPTFLAVGGAGYVVDVLAFNLLRNSGHLAGVDPTVARTLAVIPAMAVTYLGNRLITWRGRSGADLRRELCLFIVFNVIGFGFSVLTLAISHDLLGLTSQLADNVSANVVGMALGTIFRYVTYRRWVFVQAGSPVRVASAGRGTTTLARCTSWWSTTKSVWSRWSVTISARWARRRTGATTG